MGEANTEQSKHQRSPELTATSEEEQREAEARQGRDEAPREDGHRRHRHRPTRRRREESGGQTENTTGPEAKRARTERGGAEQRSGVLGLCAWEETKGGEGLEQREGSFLIELVSAREGQGVATGMIRAARGRGSGGRNELQVHRENTDAFALYSRLGYKICAEWRGEGRRELWTSDGNVYYNPEDDGNMMMRADGEELDRQLEERRSRREPPRGVRYTHAKSLQELRNMDMLDGLREMTKRIHAAQEWRESDVRAECLYAGRGSEGVQYVVALEACEDGDDATEAADEDVRADEVDARSVAADDDGDEDAAKEEREAAVAEGREQEQVTTATSDETAAKDDGDGEPGERESEADGHARAGIETAEEASGHEPRHTATETARRGDEQTGENGLRARLGGAVQVMRQAVSTARSWAGAAWSWARTGKKRNREEEDGGEEGEGEETTRSKRLKKGDG